MRPGAAHISFNQQARKPRILPITAHNRCDSEWHERQSGLQNSSGAPPIWRLAFHLFPHCLNLQIGGHFQVLEACPSCAPQLRYTHGPSFPPTPLETRAEILARLNSSARMRARYNASGPQGSRVGITHAEKKENEIQAGIKIGDNASKNSG